MPVFDIARKFALKNAFDYGKADAKAVVGKVLAEMPDAKNDMKATMAEITRAVQEANSLGKPELEKELAHFTFAKKEEKEKHLTLPNAEQGKVVTRFPPEPSGYPHIGHAKAAFLDYESALAYGGKMLLRFDDTNPEKESAEYVDAIKEGLSWLGVKWHGNESYSSDLMPEFYKYCEQMLSNSEAYVCTCDSETVKVNRGEAKACACRERNGQENLLLWKKMLSGEMKEGGAIVRYKGEMAAQNTVMRDPTLFRIISAEHYRQGKKYRAWPSYDFDAPIIDSLEGVTHAMRTKEYELRDELYFALLGKLKLRKPELIEFSRLVIKNAPISKRLLTPLIKEGKVMGWDDPRLPTLAALRRKGILPQAIRNFVLSFGLSKVESEPGWDALLNENRKLLDPVSERYFFVKEPVKLKVKDAPVLSAKMKKHPSGDKGFRHMETKGEFLISAGDAGALSEGETFRLKDLYNVKLIARKGAELSGEYAGDELKEGKKLQWVVPGSPECEILVPKDLFENDKFNPNSLVIDKGLCEPDCAKLAKGSQIQFERYGFCILDKKEGAGEKGETAGAAGKAKLTFIFTNQ